VRARLSLLALSSAFLIAGCAGEPTAPNRSAPAPRASHDDGIAPGPDGTCRTGYVVANGICVIG
jgi:hypothetical protein